DRTDIALPNSSQRTRNARSSRSSDSQRRVDHSAEHGSTSIARERTRRQLGNIRFHALRYFSKLSMIGIAPASRSSNSLGVGSSGTGGSEAESSPAIRRQCSLLEISVAFC